MSEKRAVVLETQVDTTGARAGFTEITREAGTMAGSVSRASQQADRAVDGIGSSAKTSARSVEQAQRNLIGSIQRTMAAMEAGGRTGSAYFEVLARQRGVDPKALEAYLVQLRAVEQAQAQAAQTLATQQAAQQQATESARAQAAAQRDLAQSQANRDSFVAGLREQIALFGKSTEEVLRYRAAQAGAAQESSMLILQLQNMRAAQQQSEAAARAQAAAQREAAQVEANKATFLDGLREQIALFGKSTEGMLEYRAAQLGAANAAAPLIAQLRTLREAHEQAAAAARLTAQAQRDSVQAQGARDSFIAGLREQIALFGKSADEVQRYRAAQLGASTAADPLIAQLRALQQAQDQVAASARAAAQAQQDAAQVQSRRDSFLDALREQIALYGRSTEEVQRHHAAQLGLTAVAEPLIAQLHAMRTAQEQVAAAARAADQAQREAMQVQAGKDSFIAGLREQIALFGLSTEEVQRYRAAQLGLTTAADPLIAQLHAMRVAQEQVTAAAKATAQAQREADQVQAGKDQFIRGLEQQAQAIGKTRLELIELQAAQMGVTSRAQPFIDQLRASEQSLRNGGMSAAQMNAALRGVPAQITDIVVSLQGGQAPLTVFLQQGGQLRDMFGSVGGAAKALGGAVLGLITPYTVAAAAAAALLYAYKVGHEESIKYARSLAATGNIAGTTSGQLSDMAHQIGQVTGSQHEAAGALAELIGTGAIARDNLAEFGTVAVEAQRVLGKSVSDTAAEFEKLGKSPTSALREINEKYHSITAEVYAQVRALEQQGRTVEAANLAQKAYADGINNQRQKVLDSLSDWERGWIRIKKGISGAVDAVIDFASGREASNFEKINGLLGERATIEERIARLKRQGEKRDGDNYDPKKDRDVLAAEASLDANERAINVIRDKGRESGKAAEDEGKAARATALRNRWLDDSLILLSRQKRMEFEIDAARTEGQDNGLKEEEINNRILVIRRRYNDVLNTGIDTAITKLQRRGELEALIDERTLAQIQAQRDLGIISEDDAINSAAQVQLDALDRAKTLLQDQLDLIRKKVGGEQARADLMGRIDQNDEEYRNRKEQRDLDLAALENRRYQLAAENTANWVEDASAQVLSLRQQATEQRDYNDEIGRTAGEILNLRNARLLEAAARKDADADTAEGFDLTGEAAERIRRQAAALRDLAKARTEGFVKERDPYVNLRSSLRQYAEESQDRGAMIGNALTNAFRSAEDAFAQFVTTGKLDFKSLATSIIADFARIQAQAALGSLATSALGSMGTSTSGGWGAALISAISGARANGGPVNAGLSYLVGERGPEIFTPSSTGSITPNHLIGVGAGAGGGGGGNININTTVQVTDNGATSTTSGDQSAAGRALADMISTKAREVIMRESRQGGLIWNMRMGRG